MVKENDPRRVFSSTQSTTLSFDVTSVLLKSYSMTDAACAKHVTGYFQCRWTALLLRTKAVCCCIEKSKFLSLSSAHYSLIRFTLVFLGKSTFKKHPLSYGDMWSRRMLWGELFE